MKIMDRNPQGTISGTLDKDDICTLISIPQSYVNSLPFIFQSLKLKFFSPEKKSIHRFAKIMFLDITFITFIRLRKHFVW